MRTWNGIVTAFLLVTLSAAAQQTAGQSSQTPADAPAPAQASQPANAGSTANAATPVQPASQSQPSGPPAPPVMTTPTPTTMDQVVDRTIEREHALMKMLNTRTPLVETYLQNLTLDPAAGPVPKEDHYFLGRMDLGESVDRRDYLSKDMSFQTRMMGGFTKMFKFE